MSLKARREPLDVHSFPRPRQDDCRHDDQTDKRAAQRPPKCREPALRRSVPYVTIHRSGLSQAPCRSMHYRLAERVCQRLPSLLANERRFYPPASVDHEDCWKVGNLVCVAHFARGVPRHGESPARLTHECSRGSGRVTLVHPDDSPRSVSLCERCDRSCLTSTGRAPACKEEHHEGATVSPLLHVPERCPAACQHRRRQRWRLPAGCTPAGEAERYQYCQRDAYCR